MHIACASSLLPAYLYHTAHGHLYRNVYIIKITEEFGIYLYHLFLFFHMWPMNQPRRGSGSPTPTRHCGSTTYHRCKPDMGSTRFTQYFRERWHLTCRYRSCSRNSKSSSTGKRTSRTHLLHARYHPTIQSHLVKTRQM